MKTSASLTAALGERRADRRIEVLRQVQLTGSISQAAREVGISYKAAWQAVETLTNLAGVPLVARSVGGTGGGGATLTPDALLLLEAADAMVYARGDVQRALQDKARAGDAGKSAAATALARLSVRTSMRNQWPCVVERLSPRGALVVAHLRGEGAAQDFALQATITQESAQLLGLHAGMPVLALCKATAVEVVWAGEDAEAAPNHWRGKITRISRSPQASEVALQLAGGVHIVGFATDTNGMRVRSVAQVRMHPSAVVLALVDG
ncbi:TOBE domain-containing protein [Comamonas humi]